MLNSTRSTPKPSATATAGAARSATGARRAPTPRRKKVVAAPARPIRKKRSDALANREKIIQAARVLFHERGLIVGLHEIARYTGLGAGTVYRHFPNWAALIAALNEESTGHFHEVAREAASNEDPWTALSELLIRTHEVRASDRGLWAVAMHSARKSAEAGQATFDAILDEVVARAKAAGVLREDFAATDINVLNIMVAACADFTNELDPELWRRFVTLLLDGLRTTRNGVEPLPERALSHEEVHQAMFAWYDAEGHWGPEHRRVIQR